MPGWLQALILGAIQGLTEFLPVSSSGHLVLSQQLLGDTFLFVQNAVVFDLVLHLGTLLPVLYYYRRDLQLILQGVFRKVPHEGGVMGWLKGDEHRWLAFLVVLGTLPTAFIGLGLKDTFEGLFHDARAVCGALFFTGCLLFSTRFFGRKEPGRLTLTIPIALAIGLAQGFAITPGISRSGSTIALALLLGVNRDLAARFSFLLSIPAILGAVVLYMKDGFTMESHMIPALLIGFLSAMVVGYTALWMLVALVKRGGLHKFSYYLWPVAILGWIFLG